MSCRVSPSERLRAEIDKVFATSGDLAGAVEQVARLGAQLLLRVALEAEVTAFLGGVATRGRGGAADAPDDILATRGGDE